MGLSENGGDTRCAIETPEDDNSEEPINNLGPIAVWRLVAW
jgi:hypothetical protein